MHSRFVFCCCLRGGSQMVSTTYGDSVRCASLAKLRQSTKCLSAGVWMTSTFQLQSCIFYKLGMGLFTPGARRSSRGVFQDGGVVIFISWLSVVLNAGNWDLGDTHSNTVLPGIIYSLEQSYFIILL